MVHQRHQWCCGVRAADVRRRRRGACDAGGLRGPPVCCFCCCSARWLQVNAAAACASGATRQALCRGGASAPPPEAPAPALARDCRLCPAPRRRRARDNAGSARRGGAALRLRPAAGPRPPSLVPRPSATAARGGCKRGAASTGGATSRIQLERRAVTGMAAMHCRRLA